jgi:YesN/AraC family two-component response regulator
MTASTAEEALRLVRQQRSDVVLSDIAMPGHYWLVRQIRSLPDPAAASG